MPRRGQGHRQWLSQAHWGRDWTSRCRYLLEFVAFLKQSILKSFHFRTLDGALLIWTSTTVHHRNICYFSLNSSSFHIFHRPPLLLIWPWCPLILCSINVALLLNVLSFDQLDKSINYNCFFRSISWKFGNIFGVVLGDLESRRNCKFLVSSDVEAS